jgi:tricorn protease
MRVVILVLLAAYSMSAATPPLAEPGISPDGREIAFVSGGGIWTVPASGGQARLLISHAASESRPLYSPDGMRLAFHSNRNGGTNIFVLTLATGDTIRITFNDGADNLSALSADGKWLYFHASYQEIGAMNDVFRVSSEGGTPAAVTAQKYVNEFQAAPSPSGDALVFAARGTSSSQWWRNGSSHLDQSELWLLRGANYG